MRQAKGWYDPIAARQLMTTYDNPLTGQLEHFTEVIAGEAAPQVTAEDELAAMRVLEAIKLAADTPTLAEVGA